MLLLDGNLSYRLCRMLRELYPGVQHVTSAGIARRADARLSDQAIWEFAYVHDLVIVTKDHDFNLILAEHPEAPPPRVLRLTLGNSRSRLVCDLLATHQAQITAFHADPDASLLELGDGA